MIWSFIVERVFEVSKRKGSLDDAREHMNE